jgi:hypothetical protein
VYNQITNAGAIALSKNTTLRQLNLWGNEITEAGAIALSKNTTLRQLNLGGNQITEAGAIALSKNTTLRELNLWDNQIEIVLMNKQLIKTISRLVKKEFWSFY